MRGLWNKFLNLSILKKSLLAIYISVATIFILLISILIHIGDQYSRENSLSSQNEILESAILYIQKEQNYLKGIADNIALLPTVQTQLQQNDPERYDSLSEYLSSLLVQNSGVISAALYDLDGNVAGYYSIDASHDPVDQHAELPGCRFHDIFSNISGSAWSYIPQGSTSFAAVDNSPKMVYWRIISDAKTTKPVGAIAVSMDSRRLLGSNNPPVTPFSRAIVVRTIPASRYITAQDFLYPPTQQEKCLLCPSKHNHPRLDLIFPARHMICFFPVLGERILLSFISASIYLLFGRTRALSFSHYSGYCLPSCFFFPYFP